MDFECICANTECDFFCFFFSKHKNRTWNFWVPYHSFVKYFAQFEMSEKLLPIPKAAVKKIMKLNGDVNVASEVLKCYSKKLSQF